MLMNYTLSAVRSTLLKMSSTSVEKPLQIRPFLCKTNPIFAIFRLETKMSLKNKPKFKPDSNPNKHNNELKIRVANPIRTQFYNTTYNQRSDMKNLLSIAFFALTLNNPQDYNRPIIGISCFIKRAPIERTENG